MTAQQTHTWRRRLATGAYYTGLTVGGLSGFTLGFWTFWTAPPIGGPLWPVIHAGAAMGAGLIMAGVGQTAVAELWDLVQHLRDNHDSRD